MPKTLVLKLCMWDKAITAAPSEDKKARMVMSFSSKTPHFIAMQSCTGELMKFLQWYTSCEPSPNITVLSMKGLPTGHAGQKGGRPKRKRSRNTELVTITKSDVSSECGSGFNTWELQHPRLTTMSCFQLLEAHHLLSLFH